MSKILVIDDSMFQRSMVVKVITEMGLESVQADSGEAGLKKISEENFDCILLDLLMAGVDGIEVLTRLKNDGNNIPVIILTADIQQKRKEQCLELGAADFLNKPTNKQELKESINKVLK